MISIVIPARNDAEALARTLDHLDGLEGRTGVEVIVAAAGAEAATTRGASRCDHIRRNDRAAT